MSGNGHSSFFMSHSEDISAQFRDFSVEKALRRNPSGPNSARDKKWNNLAFHDSVNEAFRVRVLRDVLVVINDDPCLGRPIGKVLSEQAPKSVRLRVWRPRFPEVFMQPAARTRP